MARLPGVSTIGGLLGPATRLYAGADRFLLLNLPVVWRSRLLLATLLAAGNLLVAWGLSQWVPMRVEAIWLDEALDTLYDEFAFITLALCAIWVIRQLRTPVGDITMRAHLEQAVLNVLAVTMLLSGPVLLGARATQRTAGAMTRASLAQEVRYLNAWLCAPDRAEREIVDELPSLKSHLAVFGLSIRDAAIGPPPSHLVVSDAYLPLACSPTTGLPERIGVIDSSGQSGYGRLVSAIRTLDHQHSLQERGLVWTQHAGWRTAATIAVVVGLGAAALMKPQRRRWSLLAMLRRRRSFRLEMPRAWRRLDRAILLEHPWLWLFRPHALLLQLVPLAALLWLLMACQVVLDDSSTALQWALPLSVVTLFGVSSVVSSVRRVDQFRTPLLQTRHWLLLVIGGMFVQLACVGIVLALAKGLGYIVSADDASMRSGGLVVIAVASSVVGMVVTVICDAYDLRTAVVNALAAALIGLMMLTGTGFVYVFASMWLAPMLLFRFTRSFRDPGVAPARFIQVWARLILSTSLITGGFVAVLSGTTRDTFAAGLPMAAAMVAAMAVYLWLISPALEVVSQAAVRPRAQ